MLKPVRLPAGSRILLLMLATTVLYVVTARLGLTLALPPEKKATAVWPPSGVALAAVLLCGYRIWPAIWLGAFFANLWDAFDPATRFSFGEHVLVSSSIAVGSTLQALPGAWLLRRWVGDGSPLDRALSVFQFAGIALLVCLIASTVGVTTMVVAGFTRVVDYPFNWWTWWIGDSVGIVIVTPLILVWSDLPRFRWKLLRFAEAALVLALFITVGGFVFGGWNPWGVVSHALAYLTVPLLVWATFRFGHHGATASLLLVSGMAIWGTLQGQGPFVQKTLNESLLLLQTFVGTVAVTALGLAAVLAERRRAEHAKATLIGQLERALTEIKTLRGLIPICAWCKKIRADSGSWEQLEIYLRDHTEASFSHGICPECLEKRRQVTP